MAKDVRLVDVNGIPLATYDGCLNIKDVHTMMVNRLFMSYQSVTTNFSASITADSTSLVVNTATGYVDNDYIWLSESTTIEDDAIRISNVNTATNTLTIDRPIINAYTIAGQIEKVAVNMTPLTGTLTTPIIYQVAPPVGVNWNITRILINMTDGAASDDNKFGGINELTNGVVIRQDNGIKTNITHWRNNGDMVRDMFDVTYDKITGGVNGLHGRWTFQKAGIVINLNGDDGDELRILIQDDIAAQTTMIVRAQGYLGHEDTPP